MGFLSRHFRHICLIDGCYLLTLTRWDWMFPAFPRGIIPTDVDGLVEIDGRFLLIEEKRLGAEPDRGQRLALERFSRLKPATVIYFRPGRDSELEAYLPGYTPGWKPTTRERLVRLMRIWARGKLP